MQTRGVRGQKIPKNANVICERPLIDARDMYTVSGCWLLLAHESSDFSQAGTKIIVIAS